MPPSWPLGYSSGVKYIVKCIPGGLSSSVRIPVIMYQTVENSRQSSYHMGSGSGLPDTTTVVVGKRYQPSRYALNLEVFHSGLRQNLGKLWIPRL